MRENIYIHWRSDAEDEDGDEEGDCVRKMMTFVFEFGVCRLSENDDDDYKVEGGRMRVRSPYCSNNRLF